jgi:hypothetical protein
MLDTESSFYERVSAGLLDLSLDALEVSKNQFPSLLLGIASKGCGISATVQLAPV